MIRTSPLLFFLALAASCQPSPSGPGVEAATTRANSLPGSYSCVFEFSEQPAAPEPCEISARAGVLVLESSGAAPLRGTLITTEGGFRFRGEILCAEPGCPLPIETDFFADESREHTYSGIAVLDSGGLLRVELRR